MHLALLETFKPYMKYLNQSLFLRLYPAQQGITASGSNAPSLNLISIMYETAKNSASTELVLNKLYTSPRANIYLDPVSVVNGVSYTLTAGSETQIDLSQAKGKTPYLLMTVRASNSLTNQSVMKNVNLGDNCAFKLCTPAGNDVLFNNTSFMQKYLRDHSYADLFDNPDFIAAKNF